MLFDIIIRLLAAIELSIFINANGITTTSVVMSVCVFLFLEITMLIKNTKISFALTMLPFFILPALSLSCGTDYSGTEYAHLIIAWIATAIGLILYHKMSDYKEKLHRTRDDSTELEALLREKNRTLLLEQDQQVHLATLNERNRIAREIHDNVGHMLSRAILLLGAIETVNKDESLEPKLKLLSDTLDESMRKMRESVHDLHDDSIDLEKNFSDIISELKDFHVDTELDIDSELPKQIKLSLIGILKESVTNIIKHSTGDSVSIILHINHTFCTLSVSDNGYIDEITKAKIESLSCDGIGLSNIKERARACEGDVYFYTNDGFTVFARLPFKNEVE
ncbi:MAG: sensor histidine kinase [Lachnospiraceae bacterium]|nr:sensor histidine kinase [Lachnospiraceae bacterium]